MKEAEIIQKCKKGHQKGYKILVDTYAPKLMGICLRYMKDEFAAKDVLQESFINIFHHIGKYEKTGSFEAWLSRIVVRKCLMQLRKNKNQSFHVELENNEHNGVYEETEIEIKLNEDDILEMIYELPDHYRIIFNMYIIEGFSHAEIAELLQISESTSRTKLTRARKKMQIIYNDRIHKRNGSDQKMVEKMSRIS